MIRRLLKRGQTKTPPRLPEGVRVYAIGDVHGRADLLERLLSRINTHVSANPVVRPITIMVGDYVDRGPESRKVLDLLISYAEGREMVFLRGNHELYFQDFLKNPSVLRDWSKIGGLETLMSYGLRPSEKADPATQAELARSLAHVLPPTHAKFLDQLLSSFSCGGYFFVHAGIRPGIPLSEQSDDDMLWIRDEFLLYEEDFGKIVVHGHTPVREVDFRRNRINIDTGAYITGRLSCVVFEGDSFEPL